ncbi:MAG: 4-hydroxyphenylacetate 3-hydroxylase family protein [Desulfarculaceae bacterium]|nr:4-hydroxyphenylacetate 3-hydroxylase family protein [Desulfarculaceae bacterium]
MERIVTKDDYLASLREQRHLVYFNGERVEDVTSHPAFRPHVNAAAKTYEMALMPEYEDLATAISHLTGERISRFTHIHQSVEDLIKKVQLLRAIAHETGSCFQRCVGWDALNATYMTTYEIDQKHGTDYHQRFTEYLKYIQASNKMVVGGMTDTKGDRSLAPHQQKDLDVFTRVTERREDGIVIRGNKAHQTGAANSHEILIMPTQFMREEDQDFALVCAVPLNSPGVVQIFGRQTNDDRRIHSPLDAGNAEYGLVGGETLIVFEDVFVPWDRVFMCGETEFSGLLVERFATLHRQNYGGCKGGVSDVLVGACALATEMQGSSKASHVKEKLAEMMHLTETLYAGSVSCSAMGQKTASGAFYPDPLLANCTKHNVTRHVYEIARLAHDVAGGILATMPSEADLRHPEIGKYVEKYLSGVEGVSTENRMRILRLIENMTGGTALVESMHGAGSPQTQKVMYGRLAKMDMKKKWAAKLAQIEE